MSSLKSALVASGLCVLAANIAVGCSASSDPFTLDDSDDSGSPVVVPDGSPEDNEDTGTPQQDAGKDTGTKDGGDGGKTADATTDAADASDGAVEAAVEAGVDAGVDAGPEGSPCPTLDLIQRQACGLCGTQARLCAPESSTPGAPLVWHEWGYCQNEVENGCVPGTETSEACGLCGDRVKVCQNNCRWAVGSCKNEPVNACTPNAKDFQVGLSCDAGGRQRTCQANCTYGPFGECFVPGEPTLTLATVAGQKVSDEFKLDGTKTMARLDGTCPSGSLSTTISPFQYITLENPSSSTLLVAVFTAKSTKPGAPTIDTVMASYDSATKPANDTARRACTKGVNDGCSDSDPELCEDSWAGLVGSSRVTVGPNAKVVIYVGGWVLSSAGDYRLIARTDTVTP